MIKLGTLPRHSIKGRRKECNHFPGGKEKKQNTRCFAKNVLVLIVEKKKRVAIMTPQKEGFS